MKSIPELLKEAEGMYALIPDESAVEILISVLRSRKARPTLATKLREWAGTNKAQGAQFLRTAAANIEAGRGLIDPQGQTA